MAEPDLPTVAIETLVTRGTLAEALARWAQFVPFRPAEVSTAPPPAVLVNDRGHPEWWQSVHRSVAPVAELGLHFLRDVTVSGHCYPFHDGAFVLDGSEPAAVGLSFARGEGLGAERLIHRAGRRVIDRPALLIGGPGYPIWGHWLLDFLPRLAIAQAVLGAALADFVIPMPADLPGWVVSLMGFFCGVTEDRLVRYDRAGETLLCRTACLPSVAHSNYHLHSFMRAFYRRFVVPGSGTAPRRFCVSRQAFGQTRHSVVRIFREERYFEEVAQRRGFAPVFPETLDFRAQIDLFANAHSIVGQYGSGMHSALFSPPGTLVGQFGMPNPIQSRIAGLCGHRMAYLIPDLDETDAQGVRIFSVSHAEIDRFFDALDATDPRA
jgi:hypothetical protein